MKARPSDSAWARASSTQSSIDSPLQDDLGARLSRGRDLGQRRSLGHEDRRRQTAGPRRVGDGLAVVAGARGDDTLRAAVEPGDLVEGAAELERARALQVLGLERDRAAGGPREVARLDDLGAAGHVGDHLAGRARCPRARRVGHAASQRPGAARWRPSPPARPSEARRLRPLCGPGTASRRRSRTRRSPSGTPPCRSGRSRSAPRPGAWCRPPGRPPSRLSRHLARLLGDAALDQLAGRGVERHLPAAVEDAVRHDGLRVGTDRGGCRPRSR